MRFAKIKYEKSDKAYNFICNLKSVNEGDVVAVEDEITPFFVEEIVDEKPLPGIHEIFPRPHAKQSRRHHCDGGQSTFMPMGRGEEMRIDPSADRCCPLKNRIYPCRSIRCRHETKQQPPPRQQNDRYRDTRTHTEEQGQQRGHSPHETDASYHTPYAEMFPIESLYAAVQKAQKDKQRGTPEYVYRYVGLGIATFHAFGGRERKRDARYEHEQREYAIVHAQANPIDMRHLHGKPRVLVPDNEKRQRYQKGVASRYEEHIESPERVKRQQPSVFLCIHCLSFQAYHQQTVQTTGTIPPRKSLFGSHTPFLDGVV